MYLVEENLEKTTKTILIVDDEQPIIDVLLYNLKKEGYRIIEANDGITAVNMALEEKPDLMLLDIMLPRLDGLSVCKRVKNSLNIPIIMLTAKDNEIDKILGLELGADDYITKPFHAGELLYRIKNVLKHTKNINQDEIIKIKNIKINLNKKLVLKDDKEVELTALEFKILQMLFENRGRIISRTRILEYIWDENENFVNDNTLTVYIKRIREKIEKDPNNAEIIKTVRGIGYKILDEG